MTDYNDQLSKTLKIQISYHPSFKASERPKISSPKHCHEVLLNYWNQDKIELQEQVYIMLLNTDHFVLGIAEIACGRYDSAVIDSRVIVSIALKSKASSVIICHNHPSGSVAPSEEDIQFTRQLVEAGKILQLPILDHLIITEEGYFSFS